MTNPSFAPDQPAKIDLFKRKPFAIAFAKSLCLKKNSAGLVVGIEGAWGSGKTSVINFIKDELEKNDTEPLIIEFNPWMTSGSEALVEILLTQLASALGSVQHDTKKGLETAEKIIQYVELLKFLKYVPAFSWAGNIAEDSTAVAGKVTKSFKKLLPGLDLAKTKVEVEKKLSSLDKPIIVIIDDIDRLTYSEIRHLFQAIKSVADFPRVTYLLAYDLNQITTALDQEFGKDKGQNYIEKIVQISYPIPVIMPLQMLAYTRSKMDDLFSRLSIKPREYESKYLEQMLGLIMSLQKNPRDMIRLVNRLVIAIPNTRNDINICDVIVLEAIGLKYGYLRTLLYQRPELFTGRFWTSDENGMDFDWSQFLGDDKEKNQKRWIEELPTNELERKVLMKSFKFLFPNLNGEDELRDADLDELRIGATDRLQRYFALTSLDDSVDVEEIHDLFKYPQSLETYLDFDDETILRQLSDLDKYVSSADISNFEETFQIFTNKTNYLCKQAIINKSVLELLANILLKILKKTTNDKCKYFSNLIKETPLCLSINFIDIASSDLGLWSSARDAVKTPLIDDKQIVIDARIYWADRIREEVKHSSFLLNVNASDLVWTWWHLSQNKDEVLNAIKNFFINSETVEVASERLLPLRGYLDINDMVLIWDREELESILKKNPVTADKYKHVIKQLSQQDVIEWFERRKNASDLASEIMKSLESNNKN